MKKILIFILFLSLFGCNSIVKNKQTLNNFNCPRIFFSPEDRIYIDTIDDSGDLDDLSLKAELNNFALIEKCYEQNNIFNITLDILIIAKPMDKLVNPDLSIPLYALLLDQNDELLDTQYFMISGSFKRNFETNAFLETDIIDKLKIMTMNSETTQIVIGFMIDNKKRLLMN